MQFFNHQKAALRGFYTLKLSRNGLLSVSDLKSIGVDIEKEDVLLVTDND